MKKLSLLAAVATVAMVTANTQADESSPEVYLGALHTNFDRMAGFDDTVTPELGVAFPVNNNFFVELWGTKGTADIKGLTDAEGDLVRIGLNGLLQFDVWENTKPFVTLGLSNRELEVGDSDSSNAFGDLGVGLKHYFGSSDVIARLDVIKTQTIDSNELDDLLTRLAIGYNFGERGTKAPAPAPIVAPVVVAPVVAAPVDTDGDGVFDKDDNCPSTQDGLKVDASGCAVVLKENVTIELRVNFANNSSEVTSEYYPEVKQVADFLSQYKGTTVEIQGYTDDRGSAEYNRKLSDRRAKAVAAVLTNELGVSSSRVGAKGYGEVNFIGDNATAEGRAQNRRVVAEVSAEKVTNVKK